MQAVPFVRCIGESWPLTRTRAYFEHLALKEQALHAPEHVPKVFHFDQSVRAVVCFQVGSLIPLASQLSLIVMQYLSPPHVVLRKGLVAGVQYPHLASHTAAFLANALFKTSVRGPSSSTYCSLQTI